MSLAFTSFLATTPTFSSIFKSLEIIDTDLLEILLSWDCEKPLLPPTRTFIKDNLFGVNSTFFLFRIMASTFILIVFVCIKGDALVDILDKFSEFKKALPNMNLNSRDSTDSLEEAVKTYVKLGGIVKIDNIDSETPKLIYPGKKRIETQIELAEKHLDYLNSQIQGFKKRQRHLSYDSFFSGALRFTDLLFWEHILKQSIDADYRKTVKIVEPPIERMKDPKWRKMVKMFVKSKEYRDRLLEARTSPLGKKRATVKRFIQENLEYSRNLMDRRIKKISKEKEKFEKKLKTFYALQKWTE